jgi:hypothetical protein
MDKTALVSFDIESGQRVIQALESDGIVPDVALWAVLPQYEDWRLVIASKYLNQKSLLESYGIINASMRKAKFTLLTEPTVFFCRMDEPLIEGLRSAFASVADTYGMRLGGQKFGNQYIEEAFVYRIR